MIFFLGVSVDESCEKERNENRRDNSKGVERKKVVQGSERDIRFLQMSQINAYGLAERDRAREVL